MGNKSGKQRPTKFSSTTKPKNRGQLEQQFSAASISKREENSNDTCNVIHPVKVASSHSVIPVLSDLTVRDDTVDENSTVVRVPDDLIKSVPAELTHNESDTFDDIALPLPNSLKSNHKSMKNTITAKTVPSDSLASGLTDFAQQENICDTANDISTTEIVQNDSTALVPSDLYERDQQILKETASKTDTGIMQDKEIDAANETHPERTKVCVSTDAVLPDSYSLLAEQGKSNDAENKLHPVEQVLVKSTATDLTGSIELNTKQEDNIISSSVEVVNEALKKADIADGKLNHFTNAVPYSVGPSVIVPTGMMYMNYAFLTDPNTVQYVQEAMVMFIMRGLPGSGKSTVADLINRTYKNSVVCSADHYFYRNGVYQFDSKRLPQAHKQCQDRATRACNEGKNVVIIDNTNVKKWEMNFYLGLAQNCNYTVVIVTPQTPWRLNAAELAKRTEHGVSFDILRDKVHQFETILPLFWGWFSSPVDSHNVMALFEQYFHLFCDSFPGMIDQWKQIHGHGELSLSFLYPNQRSKLHCTAFFGGRGRGQDPYINTYAKDRNVIESMGKMFELTIVGFMMTVNTVGARVLLDDQELVLWYKDDDEISPNSSIEYGHDTSFTESMPTGSRAHMTLAFAQGSKAVQTGLDLLDLVRLEVNHVPNRRIKRNDATLCYYDCGICYAHLDQPIRIKTLFSGSY